MTSRFRIHRTIEEAPWFELAIATLEGDERTVRLFRTRPGLVLGEAERREILADLSSASRVHHEALSPLLGFGSPGGALFASYEHHEGLTLDELAADTDAPTTEEVLLIALCLSRALEAAHALLNPSGAPTLHGAIRPSKIVVARDGQARLTGLGLDRLLEPHLTAAGATLKDRDAFLPPSHRGARPVTDPAVDVVALGCVIHHLLAGRSPFYLAQAQPVIAAGIDDDARLLIEAALRGPSIGTFSAELERIAGLRRAGNHRTLLSARVSAELDRRATPPGRASPPGRAANPLDLAAVLGSAVHRPEQERPPTVIAPSHVELITGDAAFTEIGTVGELGTWSGGTEESTDDRTPKSDSSSSSSSSSATPVPAESSPHRTREDSGRLAGRVVMSYRLHELIGSGTFSHVYRATHLHLNREYAVKVIREHYGSSEVVRRRLSLEAEALIGAHHPNLVEVFDFGVTEDSRPFLVMELLRGETLAQAILRGGPFPSDRALTVTRQIAQGLAALHRRGLVHRDLKPGNVILVSQGDHEVAKIVDLGIVRQMDRGELTQLTRVKDMLGTPAFMAPEQILSPSTVGPEADLYALGAILFSMLTGRPPFSGTVDEVIQHHLDDVPPGIPGLDESERIVQRLLAKRPESRFRSAEALIAILDRASGVPVHEETLSIQEATAPARQRSSAPLASWDPRRSLPPSATADPRASLPPAAMLDPRPSLTPSIEVETQLAWRGRLWGLAIAGLVAASVAAIAVAWHGSGPTKPAVVDLPDPTHRPVTVTARLPSAVPGELGSTVEPTPADDSTPADPRGRASPAETAAKHAAGRTSDRGDRGDRGRSVRASPQRLESQLRSALERMALTRADASRLLGRAATVPSGDDGEASLAQMIAALEQAPLDGAFMRARLDRVLGKLRQASASLPLDETKGLEDRYFQLRKTALGEPSPEQARHLNREAHTLERDLDRRLRGAP
ncbi:MAG: protein kinase [Deltaproteobacteria bacterium]|nr:protein kinase [Deltaproteobacteria bacterium]